MSRLRAFILAGLAVGLVAGSSVGVAAQSSDPVTTTAGINADTVDGRHAVGATNKAATRAGKLVATSKQGLLPSNIVKPLWSLIQGLPAILTDGQVSWAELTSVPGDLADGKVGWGEVANKPADLADGQVGWGEVANKPADLADGQVSWNEITGKPAGFADNVDNGAFVSVATGEFGMPAGNEGSATWGPFGVNVEVDFSVALTSDGLVQFPSRPIEVERFGNNVYYTVWMKNIGTGAVTGKVRYRVYADGISPARLDRQLSKVKVTFTRHRGSRAGR